MNLVLFMIPLLLVALLSFSFCETLKIRPAFGPIISLSGIIVLLFFFAVVNQLVLGYFVAYAASIVFFIFSLRKYKWKSLVDFLLSPPIVFFFAVSAVVTTAYFVNHSVFTMYDDFMHWGVFDKSVYYTNQLHIFRPASEEFAHADYPQGATLLFYFFAHPMTVFKECAAYSSVAVLTIAGLATLMGNVKWNQRLQTVIMFVTMGLIPFLFPQLYPAISIMTDCISAVFLGAIILLMLVANERDTGKTISLAILLFAFVQIKQINMFFVPLLCVTYAIVPLMNRKSGVLTKKPRREAAAPKAVSLNWARFALIVSPVVSYLIWKWIIDHDHISGQFSFGIGTSLNVISKAIHGDPTVTQILAAYVKGIVTVPTLVNFFNSQATFVILTTAGLFLAGILFSQNRDQDLLIYNIAFPVYYVGYTIVMFILYCTSFPLGRALANGSMGRYNSTVFLAWLMLILGSVFYFDRSEKVPLFKNMSFIALSVVMLFVFSFFPSYAFFDTTANDARSRVDQVINQFHDAINPSDTLWVISQDNLNAVWYVQMIYHFDLFPFRVELYTPDRPDNSDGTVMTATDFCKYIDDNHITKILVDDSVQDDTALFEKYGSLFPDHLSHAQGNTPCLYAVVKENGKNEIKFIRNATVITNNAVA